MPALVDREKQAQDEMAATRVGRGGAWVLTGSLLLLLVTGPAMEVRRAARKAGNVFAGEPKIPTVGGLAKAWNERGFLAANRDLKSGLLALEDRMGRDSAVSTAIRPAAQWGLYRALEYGNSQVVVADRGHLYYQTAFEYLTGPPFLEPLELARRRASPPPAGPFEPDPFPGLERFARDLAKRGIRLLFLPVPVKAQIHPEPLLRGRDLAPGALGNRSTAALLERLEAEGIATYDPAADLRAAALAGETVYFPTDTHWNPRGMAIAARGLARRIAAGDLLPPTAPAGFERRTHDYEFRGDLVVLLGLGPWSERIPKEHVVLDSITALGGGPLRPPTATVDAAEAADSADVLVLGDSYSMVFDFAFASVNAGFADQLAFELDRPVRRAARLAASSFPDRVRWLRQEPELLDGVELVVYEVTARSFITGDWTPTPLERRKVKKRRAP